VSEAVQIAIISMIGGVLIAYITNVVAKKVQEKKAEKQPKDRMEQMFDGYERLIKQMADEDERKARIIRDQQKEIAEMKIKLNAMEDNLANAQDDLIESHKSKQLLTKELDKMRREYSHSK
jgi:Na+-translocating ferredoxin:NAD+ oxidoreductase RnfG subunit